MEYKTDRIFELRRNYESYRNVARLKGNMMDDKDFVKEYLNERYKRINNIPRTVGEVAGTYPDNILLITMNGILLDS